jgi:predicted DNA-binding WGR domain protein
MTNDPYRDALAELFAAYAQGTRVGAEAGARLSKRKDLKDGLALLARDFKHQRNLEFVLQRCVEAEPSHPLHQAVRALALAGALPMRPWTPIAGDARPKRWITRLLLSTRAPEVYAVESEGRVSVWSLTTGALEVDLALPGGKKARASKLVELASGALRVAASDGVIVERAPGARAFTRVMALDEVRYGWVSSPDLRFHVTRAESQSVEDTLGLVCHDVEARTSREIRLPTDSVDNLAWIDWAGGRVAMAGRRSIQAGPDEWREEHALFLVDPAHATFEQLPFAQELRSVDAGKRPGTLRLTLVGEDAEGYEESSDVEFDLATRATTPAPEEEGRDWRYVPMDGGLRYDVLRSAIVDADDRIVGGYLLAEDPHHKLAVWDAPRGQLVLAGGDPATALTIVRPYDPAREGAAPAAPPPEPLAWARPGVRLSYEISDFDATYTFEVLEADGGLSLAIHMGAEQVAAAARFSAAALESATKIVAIAQGGADVDLRKEQTKVLPPIVLARAGVAKLAAGKSLAWKSEWSEPGKLEGAARETCVVRVDGAERPLAAITASSEQTTLTVLDDLRWPLVLARVEGDCHVRLEAIDTSRAGTAAAPDPAKAEPAARAKADAPAAPAAASGAARRFEMSEGGSQKFWEVAVEGPALTVRFGKIGTAGTTQTKTLASAEAATKEADKLVREKTKKGYVPA